MIRDLLIKLLFNFRSVLYKENPFSQIAPDDENKHEEGIRNFIYFCLILWTIVLFFTYAIPEDILDRFPLLKTFVDILAGILPCVANLGKYSMLPQVTQLIYAISIVLLPILAFFLRNKILTATHSRLEVWGRNPIVSLFFISLFTLGMTIGNLFILPVESNENTTKTLNILTAPYYSKLTFAFSSTIYLSVYFLGFVTIIVYIKSLPKIFCIKNKV